MYLDQYKGELYKELESILAYWMTNTIDDQYGGFIGKIDDKNISYRNAQKGSVLNARILWTFSAAYDIIKNKEYLVTANRAFEYILEHFIDKKYGGVFWSVDYSGKPLDTKKQVYAIAFTIYACSEYYKCSGDDKALHTAVDLYRLIQEYSYDKQNGGYLEAFTKDWQQLPDLRLSNKDANEKKTMNTHLHILEAYSNLYKVYRQSKLADDVKELLQNFDDYFINKTKWQHNLFFDENWELKPGVVSYGHDIEAGWLLVKAAEAIQDSGLIKRFNEYAINISDAVCEAIDKDGGLWYECDPEKGLIKEKHWWPQAEAMIGFFNAWQITKDENYLQLSKNSWYFIKRYILDKEHGEWFWGINEDYSIMNGQDKVGIWKCPYHNARACIEIINRIKASAV